MRLPTNPVTGEVMTVFARLIFSSSSRACACANCARARSSCGLRRLIAGVRVVEGLPRNELPLEKVARAIEVGLREPEIRLALPDRGRRHFEGRLRLLHLLQDLAVLDLRERLAARHRSPSRTVTVSRRPLDLRHGFDCRRANQVADHRDALRHVGALHRRQVRPSSAAAGRRRRIRRTRQVRRSRRHRLRRRTHPGARHVPAARRALRRRRRWPPRRRRASSSTAPAACGCEDDDDDDRALHKLRVLALRGSLTTGRES